MVQIIWGWTRTFSIYHMVFKEHPVLPIRIVVMEITLVEMCAQVLLLTQSQI